MLPNCSRHFRRPDKAAPARARLYVLPSDELVYVEELRQEEVPVDHEHDQTHGNNNTNESFTGPDHRSNDHPRDQADRKPDRRILHVAEHELTLARPTSVRSAAARNRHADFTKKGDEVGLTRWGGRGRAAGRLPNRRPVLSLGMGVRPDNRALDPNNAGWRPEPWVRS